MAGQQLEAELEALEMEVHRKKIEINKQQDVNRQVGFPPPHTHTTHTPHTNTTQHQTPTHKHTHTNTRTWSRWSRWLPDRSLQQTPAGVRVLMYMCGMCACVHVLCA